MFEDWTMDLKSMFLRGKQASESEKRRAMDNVSGGGAHELFLEYEGLFGPSKPRPRRSSTAGTRLATPRVANADQQSKAKLSQELLRDSENPYERSRKSFSALHDVSHDPRSHTTRMSSRRKKGFFSLKRSTREEREDYPDRYSQSPRVCALGQENVGRTPRSGWLRRCISTNSRVNPSPPPSSPAIAPYYESLILENDDDYTALPTLPGYENEPYRPPEKLPSGAAARAAAAAQNELLDTIRNLRLAEPEVNRDSESGVGIEVRDVGDLVADFDFDVPIARRDPLGILPEELVGQILAYLDANSLMNAEVVSRDWHQSASSHYVWRDVFRAEFQDRCETIAVPNVGRPGLGKVLARQDWKNMWRARKALEQRWKDNYAAAIYLEGHKDSVYCVQFDEGKILTGSRDRTVRIWDAHTYECVKVLGVPSRGAGSAVPPLQADMADRGHRPFKKVFSPPSSVEPTGVSSRFFHTGSILCLQYDSEVMITGSSDCTLIIWDVKADYKPVMRLRSHTAGVLDVCFDEKHIVSCSKDATICLWDRLTGSFLRRLTGHRGPVNAVQLRGDLVVSASGDDIAKLWNIQSGLCIKEFSSRDRGMACVEFSPDSRIILAGGNDQVIYQFDTSTGELVREMKGHEGLVRSLHLDSASGRIVSGSYDTSVKAYDLRSGETIVNFTKWTSSWILSAKADYRRIIATSQDSRAVIMDFGYQLPGIESLEA